MRIGFSGHQRRNNIDWEWVRLAIDRALDPLPIGFEGVCSLAVGADQVFAESVRAQCGRLVVVVPRDDYETFFHDPADRASYKQWLELAAQKIELHHCGTPEESFFYAGRFIAGMADALMVVWDGKPARGLGGTADVVQFARKRGCAVLHINPVSQTVRGHEGWCLMLK